MSLLVNSSLSVLLLLEVYARNLEYHFLKLILERKRGKGRETEMETLLGRSSSLCVHWLTLSCALTGDQTQLAKSG